MQQLKKTFANFFTLRGDIAPMTEITERIHAGGILQGTNFCILILAIFIASIGLNMNSTAVIIGAMLISPLMGVILSIGYGLATYDTPYVRQSFVKLFAQVAISVCTSALYFSLSPIDTPSSELLARTTPTIWDVLIAVFGGLAGIIGMTRLEKSNVIPGVAIATALMPPLCTAGYGIAVHSLPYTLGALYLFFINSFFICLSAFFVLKLIGVPSKAYVSETVFRRQRHFLIALSIVIVIPSLYLAYGSVRENLENVQAQAFLTKYITSDSRQAINYQLNRANRTLEVLLIGTPLADDEIAALEKTLNTYPSLDGFALKILQNQSSEALSPDDLRSMIDNRLQAAKKTGVHTSTADELKKYQQLSVRYAPAYQKEQQAKDLEAALKKKIAVLFPKITAFEIGTLQESRTLTTDAQRNPAAPEAAPSKAKESEPAAARRYMAIVYVQSPLSADEAARLQEWLESEAKGSVVLNVQNDAPNAGKAISGNGIVW